MEVLANARYQGLSVLDIKPPRDILGAIEALASAPEADVYNIASFMSDDLISLFYSASNAVLANSGHEPFGLVGLEVMAAGGVAFVGSTGEDYAVPFLNSVVLDTDDPVEISIGLEFLRTHPDVVKRLRSDAQETARSFSWKNVLLDTLLGKLEYAALRQLVNPPRISEQSDASGANPVEAGLAPSGPPDGAPASPGSRASDSAAPQSPAYGGASAPTHLSIKPRKATE